MKTIKKSIALAALSTAILISSCKQTQMLPLSLTGHNGVKFSGVSLKGVKGEIKVNIKNPNPVEVTVYRSDLDIKLNDMPIGKAKIKKRFVIPANSEVEEVLYLKSDFSNLGYSDIPKVINTVQSKNINLSVIGNLKSGRFMHKTKTIVEMTDTINMEEKARPVFAFLSKVGKKSVRFFSRKACEN